VECIDFPELAWSGLEDRGGGLPGLHPGGRQGNDFFRSWDLTASPPERRARLLLRSPAMAVDDFRRCFRPLRGLGAPRAREATSGAAMTARAWALFGLCRSCGDAVPPHPDRAGRALAGLAGVPAAGLARGAPAGGAAWGRLRTLRGSAGWWCAGRRRDVAPSCSSPPAALHPSRWRRCSSPPRRSSWRSCAVVRPSERVRGLRLGASCGFAGVAMLMGLETRRAGPARGRRPGGDRGRLLRGRLAAREAALRRRPGAALVAVATAAGAVLLARWPPWRAAARARRGTLLACRPGGGSSAGG